MKEYKVMVGTVLIILSHMNYFNLKQQNAGCFFGAEERPSENNESMFKDDCPDCCKIIFYA